MKVSARPPRLLTRIFTQGWSVSPARPALTVSREKDEKVVNAPRYPVISSRRMFGVSRWTRSARAKIKPIKKHLIRLTVSVPHGNCVPQALAASKPML
jgi:ribosomal protein L31E